MERVIEFFRANCRQIIGLVALIVVALLALLVVWVVLLLPDSELPKEDVVPAVVERNLSPTELSEITALFGPWQSPHVDVSGLPVIDAGALVMLMEDGGMRVSAWRVRMEHINPENGYAIAFRPPEISAMTIGNDGTIRLQTNKGRIFTVSIGQPFILEQIPTSIYKITSGGAFMPIGAQYAAEKLRYKKEVK